MAALTTHKSTLMEVKDLLNFPYVQSRRNGRVVYTLRFAFPPAHYGDMLILCLTLRGELRCHDVREYSDGTYIVKDFTDRQAAVRIVETFPYLSSYDIRVAAEFLIYSKY